MDLVLKGLEIYVKVMFVAVASISLIFLLPAMLLDTITND